MGQKPKGEEKRYRSPWASDYNKGRDQHDAMAQDGWGWTSTEEGHDDSNKNPREVRRQN